MTALNVKTKPSLATRITPAIIINFIYYRHSFLNVCLPSEDAQLLYGFNNKQERTLFKELIKTNGVGPKLALAILSGMSAQQFVNAVEREEVGALVKLPGIGKKTAERLIVEMKDRFKGLHGDLFTPAADLVLTSPASPATDDAEQEAVAALVALGYKPQEASRMVSKIARPDASSETLIREALRAAL